MKYKKNRYPDVSEAVLRKLKQGDRDAFDKVYHACKERIYGNLIKLLKSEEMAREMLQKVFIRLWDKHALIDPAQPIHAWMHRIATNMVIDYFRKAARDRKLEAQLVATAEKGYSHVEEDLQHKQLQAVLNDAIEKLSPRRKEVFKLIKQEGKSYQQVSKMLGISESTINDHIVKANHSIQKQINRMGLAGVLLLFCVAERIVS